MGVDRRSGHGTDELILINVLPLWKSSTCARGKPVPLPADFAAVLLNIFAPVRNRKHLQEVAMKMPRGRAVGELLYPASMRSG